MRFLKEYLIVIAIIILIAVIEVITSKCLNNSIDWMYEGITSIENKIKENNEGDAEKEFNELKDKWKEKTEQLACFVEHNELEKVSNDIVIIDSNLKSNDTEKSLENIAELKFMLEHIKEKNSLMWKNLF